MQVLGVDGPITVHFTDLIGHLTITVLGVVMVGAEDMATVDMATIAAMDGVAVMDGEVIMEAIMVRAVDTEEDFMEVEDSMEVVAEDTIDNYKTCYEIDLAA